MSGKSRLFWVVAFVCILAGAAYAALTVESQPVSAPDVGKHTAEVGIASPWTQVVADASTVDNSGNPVTTEAQVEAVHPYPAAKRLDVSGAGSHLVLRMKYENALTGITPPTVSVLAFDINGAVEKLRTLRGELSVALTTTASGPVSGIYRYTVPDGTATFPLRGAQQVVVAVEGALSGTGTVSTSTIEARTFSAVGGAEAAEPGLLTSLLAEAVSINTQTMPLITSGAGGYVRQDSTATIAKETGGMLSAATTAVQAKVCATTLSSVTTATWTGIPAGGQTYLAINAASVTSGNTATMTVWGSPDNGTTQRVMLRADTLAPAKAVAIAVGATATPNATYVDAFAVLRAGCTHIYLAESAPGTNNFTYSVAGF